MSEIAVRAGRREDVDAIVRMLAASADSQGEPDALCVTAADLLREGFGDTPSFQALLAEADGAVVGLALYTFGFSTWTSVNGIHLEDLYVEPAWRRHGVAHALMRELAAVARRHGCRRLRWFVLRSNESARRFYESIGGEVLADWIYMQMDAAVLEPTT